MDWLLGTELAGILVLFKYIDYRLSKRNGNPGHLTAIKEAIERVDQTLDSMAKDIAFMKGKMS